ncbi:unnamed protein product [Somion occarium]|uniref:Uncharacterized protein n=1 Tax=Somion occarium TaxID=3059160 RepID=A0ABP1DYA2_9APHY
MPTDHDDMATKPPQSLPSFAQTFGGTPTFARLSETNNALPPIHHRPPSFERNRGSPAQASPRPQQAETKQPSRKRLHVESSPGEKDERGTPEGRRSPRIVRIKEEADYDAVPPSTQSRPASRQREERVSLQAASSASNPSKRRRVTISGMSQSINTDVRRPSVDNGISPVVMGFTIQRDDPSALEQRRNSVAGIPPPTAPPTVNIVNPRTGSEERQGSTPKPTTRGGGRSPNLSAGVGGPRRSVVASSSAAPPAPSQTQAYSNARQPSPAALVVPTQQRRESTSTNTQPAQPPAPAASGPATTSQTAHLHPPPPPPPSSTTHAASQVSTHSQPPPAPPANALPAPPISFSRRRAGRLTGGGKPKPADIMISPRDTQSDSSLQPIIQSAPPIPRTGQGLPPSSGRSMAIPTLPSVSGHRRMTSGQVPPTPTRIAMQQRHAALGRSPPDANVPIATSLVPPTPASFHHPGYSGEKSAFLAPFEMFYDALNDSKQLKTWLGDQLHKSQTLMASLQRQQEQLDETVNSLVDKRVATMREEVYGLRVRVDELEQALRTRGSGSSGYSPNMTGKTKGKAANGYPPQMGVVPETYTFPAIDPLRRPEPIRRLSSPGVDRDNDPRSVPGSHSASPVPFDVGRRLSVSAMRLDPPPARHHDLLPPPPPPSNSGPSRPSFSSHPHPRDPVGGGSPYNHGGAPPPVSGWSPRMSKSSLPTSSTRSSLNQSLSSSDLPGGVRHSTSAPGPPLGQRYSMDARYRESRDREDLDRERDRVREREVERDSERERDRDRDRERERERGDPHPASSQLTRDSISSPQQKSRPRSPMDTS